MPTDGHARRRRRRLGALAALGTALLAALVAGVWRDRPPTGAGAASPAPASARPVAAQQGGAPPAVAPALAPGPAARLQRLTENLALVDHTYCSYRDGTRYPAASRPIAEHPDQVYPNAPVTEASPMRVEGGGVEPKVLIQSSQSRVFMAAGEAVAFSLRALDAAGTPQALVVTRAVAQGITFKGARPTTQLPLLFADDGKGADALAGDGAFAAVLAPAQTGLAAFAGTIRTEVRYSAGGRAGVLLFDVIYTPQPPATWSGQVREALEGGSLHFYLKAEIRQAGRYIVTGRVDDAKGQPFALATFNDLLPAGPNEIRLTMFGKLLRDREPALPLTLRDVDGYLLKENTDPDRALMARLEGKVYTSRPHPLTAFSDAEWESEERSRYLAEFAKDLEQARAALAEFAPGRPLPKSACIDSLNRPANQR